MNPAGDLQKIFEFVVKHRGSSLTQDNAAIRSFLRWAAYYRRLFIVWSDVRGGGRRIAAVAVAWRTVGLRPSEDELNIENTEYGDNLYVYQVIVHPDFRHTGVLFQLLSLALWRYQGVVRAYWYSEHHGGSKTRILPIAHLAKKLADQVQLAKLRPYIRRRVWEEAEKAPAYPTLKPVR